MMVRFLSLTVENLKRFSGVHTLPLSGEGPITVIAAENGVGKTTLLDAFYLALHGRKGITLRKGSGVEFNQWLFNAYASTASFEGGYGKLAVRLEMETEEGNVAIDRQYWLEQASGEVSEEEHLYIDGELLRLEVGEQRTQVLNAWMEALLPPSIAQRFLVDGEQLGTLDVRQLGEEMKQGLDDVLGQGTVHRLGYHLRSVQRKTLAELAPEHERESLSQLLEDVDERAEALNANNREVKALRQKLGEQDKIRQSLRDSLQLKSKEEGSALGQLRIAHAQSNSVLAQKRSVSMELFAHSLPFLIGGLGVDLEELEHARAVEALRQTMLQTEVRETLNTTLGKVEPPLTKHVKASVLKTANQLLAKAKADVPPVFRFLDHELLDAFTLQYALHVQPVLSSFTAELDAAHGALIHHREITEQLSAAAQMAGLAQTADELEKISIDIGHTEASITALEAQQATLETLQNHDKGRIAALQSQHSSDSKHLIVSSLVDRLQAVLAVYATLRRDELAQPLSKHFGEGFTLLSRKANRIKDIAVDVNTYDVEVSLAGFDGNWLERDLSATERQHVGLSLLFALRRLAKTALPVVVDTPTSRMDKRHKGYSVTKFYPQLSHQVIVLATSDDLAGGLYEELKTAKDIGVELLLRETGDAAVKVEETSLAEFFEVEP